MGDQIDVVAAQQDLRSELDMHHMADGVEEIRHVSRARVFVLLLEYANLTRLKSIHTYGHLRFPYNCSCIVACGVIAGRSHSQRRMNGGRGEAGWISAASLQRL